MTVLEARGLAKSFGPVHALAGVDFELRAGEIHALLGENGAGKSTLLGVIAGVHARDRGELELFGAPFAPETPAGAARAGVAIIHQELCLSAELSVEANIVLGREATRWGLVSREDRRERAQRALARLGSEIDPARLVAELGPGDRQVVEIARALAFDAKVLILDEPTSSLTRVEALRLFDVLRALREEGTAIVYVSHFLEEVCEIADRYTVLRDGRSVATGRIADASASSLVEAMSGRHMGEVYPPRTQAPGEVLLEVDELRADPAPLRARFALRRGEISGIFGLVGAGRSELLRALFGLLESAAARVRLSGRALADAPTPRASWRRGIGFASEDRKDEGLALELSIATNLALSCTSRYARGGIVQRDALRASVEASAARFGVKCRDVQQLAGELSGGNQQKVALARLFHHDVDVFLLDEPTRGIDVGSKAEIYAQLDAAASAGKAILVVSSYVPELLGICDRVAVMHRGELGPARAAEDWDEHSLLEAAARGEVCA